MPRNSDFPDCRESRLTTSTVGMPLTTTNQSRPNPKKIKDVGGFPPTKGVVKAPKKGSTDTKSLYEKPRDPSLERAAAGDWRNRGLSNSEIIDH